MSIVTGKYHPLDAGGGGGDFFWKASLSLTGNKKHCEHCIRCIDEPVRVKSLEEHEGEGSRVEEMSQYGYQSTQLHLMMIMMIMIMIIMTILMIMMKVMAMTMFTKSWLSAALAPAITQS